MADLTYQEAKILNTASQSGELNLRAFRLVAIDMPAAWTAAAITFVACGAPDNARAATTPEPFDSVVDSAGTEVSITVAASKYVVLSEAHRQALAGLARVKITSGPNAAQVAQGADRVLTLVVECRESNT